MNNQETITQLETLKLKGMAEAFKGMLSLPVQDRPSLEMAVAKMAESEILNRNQRRTEMYLKTSKLRYSAVLEDVACSADGNLGIGYNNPPIDKSYLKHT